MPSRSDVISTISESGVLATSGYLIQSVAVNFQRRANSASFPMLDPYLILPFAKKGKHTATVNILICGETFSPNLGDGLIAQAMQKLVSDVAPGATVQFYDFAGRTGPVDVAAPVFSRPGSKTPSLKTFHRSVYGSSSTYASALNLLQHYLPQKMRQRRKRLAYAMTACDRVIVGGGQLLQDNRLAFPLAIHTVVTQAEEQLVPVDFFSVGVGARWSKLAAYLLRRSLLAENVGKVMCRDELSATRLRTICPDASGKIGITYDAVLGLDDLPRVSTPGTTIGLCLMHPHAIRIASVREVAAKTDLMIEFWSEIALQLLQCGHEIRLFTNGAPKDQQFAASVMEAIQSSNSPSGTAVLLPRPRSPKELVELIAQFGVVVAHRLHANIVSTLLGIPNVALEWDAKVEDFMAYSAQRERFIRSGSTPAEVVDVVRRAVGTRGLDDNLRQKFLSRLQDDLSSVLTLHPSAEGRKA